MKKNIVTLLTLVTLLTISQALTACAELRTKVYLWPPAADVNDP
jgi:hypothetical protein